MIDAMGEICGDAPNIAARVRVRCSSWQLSALRASFDS
jgi:hypothetical protein